MFCRAIDVAWTVIDINCSVEQWMFHGLPWEVSWIAVDIKYSVEQ